MIFSAAALLGAALGTASGLLALCGLSRCCRSCRRKQLEDGDEAELGKTRRNVLASLQQFRLVKSTEPIQPRVQTQRYQPRPSVTSSEVISFPDPAPVGVGPPSDAQPPAQPAHAAHPATDVAVVPVTAVPVAVVPRQDSSEQPQCAGELTNVLPKLHFSLTYHSKAQELHVTIIEAERVSMSPGSEGYVSGVLTCGTLRKEVQTSGRPLSARTRWQEGLVFPVPGPEGCQAEGEVALTLHCSNPFSHHASLGAMRFKLADVAMMCNSDCWVDLQPPRQEALSAGEILLSVSYLPAANRLGVVVMKARGLQSDKLKDCIDLSVKLTLKHQSTRLKKKQTRRVKHKMNPVWNEMMMLEVPRELLARSSLEMEVLNQQQAGSGPGQAQNQAQSLGSCQLGLQASGTGLQHWQQMMDNPRKQIAMWHPLYV